MEGGTEGKKRGEEGVERGRKTQKNGGRDKQQNERWVGGEMEENPKEKRDNKRLFVYFFRYDSWRPLDITKTMSEDVRTFSTMGNFILRT